MAIPKSCLLLEKNYRTEHPWLLWLNHSFNTTLLMPTLLWYVTIKVFGIPDILTLLQLGFTFITLYGPPLTALVIFHITSSMLEVASNFLRVKHAAAALPPDVTIPSLANIPMYPPRG
jgi:hypothetical protein